MCPEFRANNSDLGKSSPRSEAIFCTPCNVMPQI